MKNRIRETRTQKKMSQSQLARLSRTTKSYISDIERGLKTPTITIAFRISKALKMKVDKLFYVDEDLQKEA